MDLHIARCTEAMTTLLALMTGFDHLPLARLGLSNVFSQTTYSDTATFLVAMTDFERPSSA